MNSSNIVVRLMLRHLTKVFVFATLAVGAFGQDTTKTTIRHGAASFDSQVKNAEVVYVEGNDLVLKLTSGKIEHLVVPDNDKFYVGGKTLTVSELKPGTKLTQTITTFTTPRYVNTVRVLKGKVWHVHAPTSVIVRLPDNTNHQYKVPSHAKFIVNGSPKTVFDLRKGMSFEATIVTDSTESVVSQTKFTSGAAPAPVAPPMVGVLLIEAPAGGPATNVASVEPPAPLPVAQPAAELPKTGSPLPLLGLLGTLALAGSIGLGAIRKRYTVC